MSGNKNPKPRSTLSRIIRTAYLLGHDEGSGGYEMDFGVANVLAQWADEHIKDNHPDCRPESHNVRK